MNENLIEMLINGGAVGITLSLIFYLYKRDKMFNLTMNNHLKHSEEAEKAVAESNNNLAVAITKLAERIDKCPLK